MTGIILVTHDGLGESLRHQAERIVDHPVNLTTVSISYRADPESSFDEVHAALAMGRDAGGVLVLTDLPGATPHNLASRAAVEDDMVVVSGVNLPMLLKVINHSSQDVKSLARLARLGGQQGITGP